MPFVINGATIKCKDDYLKKGARDRLNLSIRKDLKTDIMTLSEHIDEPVSVMFDVWVEMLQDDEELLDKFIKLCKKY